MHLLRRPAGLSLAEAIIACFVLVGALVVSGALFHTALNYSVRIDQRFVASRVAERRLEEVKSWSRNNHGTNGTMEFTEGWAAYEGVEVEDPDNPGYLVRTDVVHDIDFFSPSSAFEQVNFSSQEETTSEIVEPRVLGRPIKQITATARWGDAASEQVTLTCLVAEPSKDYGWDEADAENAITIRLTGGGPVPAVMAKNQEISVTAELKDADGETVKDPAIEWYIDPESTGSGTVLTRPHFPDRAKFLNVVLVNTDPNNPAAVIPVYGGGSVRIVARARLGGMDFVKATDPITLVGDP